MKYDIPWIKLQSFPEHIPRFKAKQVAYSKLEWSKWFIPPGWIAEAKNQKSEIL